MSLPRIAIDAMGGDEGVRVMVEGAALARRRHDKFQFLLVGDETQIKSALDTHPQMRGASEILHCEDVVGGDELPSRALRRAKTTSMGLAVNAVKQGDAGAAVSGGNTGALMAMSKLALRTMPGIDRPALAAGQARHLLRRQPRPPRGRGRHDAGFAAAVHRDLPGGHHHPAGEALQGRCVGRRPAAAYPTQCAHARRATRGSSRAARRACTTAVRSRQPGAAFVND